MIKVQIDFADATPKELAAFYEIPGMKDALGAVSTRGRELNVQFSMTGGEAAVTRLMEKIGVGMKPHIEYDEYHKLDQLGHQMILAPTRAGMGIGPLVPQIADLAFQTKR